MAPDWAGGGARVSHGPRRAGRRGNSMRVGVKREAAPVAAGTGVGFAEVSGETDATQRWSSSEWSPSGSVEDAAQECPGGARP
jgi:hypothetical protein